ncbi:MAG: hypothetical protein SFV15_05270 [Polyangiaceae bacterium]|nr:hypothetical protein [Polyangiaceae bacterium]
MREAIELYFAGEKGGALLAFLVGAASLCAATVLVQSRYELRSFAIALGVLGLVEVAIGGGLWLRTGPQVQALLSQLDSEQANTLTQEAVRMAKVQKNFARLELLWVGVLCASAFVGLTQKSRPTLWGIALALLIHAAFFLAFDLVAERRGASYLEALELARGGSSRVHNESE